MAASKVNRSDVAPDKGLLRGEKCVEAGLAEEPDIHTCRTGRSKYRNLKGALRSQPLTGVKRGERGEETFRRFSVPAKLGASRDPSGSDGVGPGTAAQTDSSQAKGRSRLRRRDECLVKEEPPELLSVVPLKIDRAGARPKVQDRAGLSPEPVKTAFLVKAPFTRNSTMHHDVLQVA
jgi:hypothetical protein